MLSTRRVMDACRVIARGAGLSVVGLALLSTTACKDLDDARVASTQMAATADALADYYRTLKTLTIETDELNALEKAIVETEYDAGQRKLLLDREGKLDERIALAAGLSTVAQSFATLTAAKTIDDAGEAAAGLEKQVSGMTPLANAGQFHSIVEQSYGPALHLLVEKLAAHKEREAAQALDATGKALAELFRRESPAYTEIQLDEVQEAQVMARALVRRGQVDETATVGPALTPFGLTARLRQDAADPNLPLRLRPVLEQQIVDRGAALTASAGAATVAMQTSLDEMAKRVHEVAVKAPMKLRLKPPALSTVERWSAGISGAVPAGL